MRPLFVLWLIDFLRQRGLDGWQIGFLCSEWLHGKNNSCNMPQSFHRAKKKNNVSTDKWLKNTFVQRCNSNSILMRHICKLSFSWKDHFQFCNFLHQRLHESKAFAYFKDSQNEIRKIPQHREQGNYSLRRPPKLIVPQAVIRHWEKMSFCMHIDV